jgi:hypothetical protein
MYRLGLTVDAKWALRLGKIWGRIYRSVLCSSSQLHPRRMNHLLFHPTGWHYDIVALVFFLKAFTLVRVSRRNVRTQRATVMDFVLSLIRVFSMSAVCSSLS